MHAIAFWLTVSLLTPFVLLVGLFNDRRRLLHDMLLGTIVINSPARRARGALSAPRPPDHFLPFDDCAVSRDARGLSVPESVP